MCQLLASMSYNTASKHAYFLMLHVLTGLYHEREFTTKINVGHGGQSSWEFWQHIMADAKSFQRTKKENPF